MVEGNFIKRNKIIKERILDYQEGRKNTRRKNIGKYINFTSPLESSRLHLVIEGKIITMSDMALDVCGGNI